MAVPVTESIALEVISRLEEITTGNGYEISVESVARVSRKDEDWTPRDKSVVVVQQEEEERPELFVPSATPKVCYDLPFLIHGFVRESDSATTDDAAAENQIGACIRKALVDATNWRTFDSNAINARIGPSKPYEDDAGDHSGITIPLFVTYRVAEDDPYTAAT